MEEYLVELPPHVKNQTNSQADHLAMAKTLTEPSKKAPKPFEHPSPSIASRNPSSDKKFHQHQLLEVDMIDLHHTHLNPHRLKMEYKAYLALQARHCNNLNHHHMDFHLFPKVYTSCLDQMLQEDCNSHTRQTPLY